MIGAGSKQRARGCLNYQQPKDFYFALGLAVLAVLLHTYALGAEFSRTGEVNALISRTIPYLLLVIELGLLLNAVGLWLRKAAGILISLTALLSVGVGYVIWYMYSRQSLALLAQPVYQLHAEAVPPHPYGLIGATLLNLVVLAIVGVLLIWEAITLRRILRPLK